jgi:hypothetical protein
MPQAKREHVRSTGDPDAFISKGKVITSATVGHFERLICGRWLQADSQRSGGSVVGRTSWECEPSLKAGNWLQGELMARNLFLHGQDREQNFTKFFTKLCAAGTPNAPVRSSLLH